MNLKQLVKRLLSFKQTRFYAVKSSKNFVHYLRKNGVKVGENVNFRYPKSVEIDLTRPSLIEFGDNIDINANFTIMSHDFGSFVFRNLFKDFVASSGKIKIGSNIYIGRDVSILKGVTIGDNCIIGLGSVVTKDIPNNSVAAGIPCKVICTIEDYYSRRKLEQVNEAIKYGISIIKTYKRLPVITDFKEEWVLFLTEDDLKKYPEMLPLVKFRLRNLFDDWFINNRTVYNGYDEFLKEVVLMSKEQNNEV